MIDLDSDSDDDIPPPANERGNYVLVYSNNNIPSSTTSAISSFATSGIPGRLSAMIVINSLVSNTASHTSRVSGGRV